MRIGLKAIAQRITSRYTVASDINHTITAILMVMAVAVAVVSWWLSRSLSIHFKHWHIEKQYSPIKRLAFHYRYINQTHQTALLCSALI
jgi:hypothetical protein